MYAPVALSPTTAIRSELYVLTTYVVYSVLQVHTTNLQYCASLHHIPQAIIPVCIKPYSTINLTPYTFLHCILYHSTPLEHSISAMPAFAVPLCQLHMSQFGPLLVVLPHPSQLLGDDQLGNVHSVAQ